MENHEELDKKNIEVAQEGWNELNPYMETEKKYKRSIIDMMEEFFSTCVSVYPHLFVKEYYELGQIARCRKGYYTKEEELFPPPKDIALSLNLVNRWNPPDRRYLYLAHSTNASRKIMGYSENEYTCLMEMRAVNGEQYTFADFEPKPTSIRHSILNMNYNSITTEIINRKYGNLAFKQAMEVVNEYLKTGIREMPTKEELVSRLSPGTDLLAIGMVGEKFLAPLCQAIFTPIDDETNSTGEERDKAYKSFHILAGFLEEKGIDGVIYPSTRTALYGYNTENLVIFKPEDFIIKEGTIRHITYTTHGNEE